jgi:hypothetical protein
MTVPHVERVRHVRQRVSISFPRLETAVPDSDISRFKWRRERLFQAMELTTVTRCWDGRRPASTRGGRSGGKADAMADAEMLGQRSLGSIW